MRYSEGFKASIVKKTLDPLCQYSCRPLRRQLDEVQQEFQKWYSEKSATAREPQCLLGRPG